jgi:serine/arginine repetitive matrix protein 1
MSKTNLDVIKPWITKRLQELLGVEDDVVIEFVFNQLEEKV